MKNERELFELCIAKLGKTDSYTFDKHDDGSYKFDMIHFGWKIWQASANRQGYKLVPVEPTLKMVRASEHIKSSKTIRQDIYKAMINAI